MAVNRSNCLIPIYNHLLLCYNDVGGVQYERDMERYKRF